MTHGLSPADLLVCTKCLRGEAALENGTRPGAHLFHRLLALGMPDTVRVTGVECLQNCDRGCSIALRGPGRWTYVYGNLHENNDVDVVAEGAMRYQAAPNGLVPWRDRSDHFRKNCIARIPPMEAPL